MFLLEILRSLQRENTLKRTSAGWTLPELDQVRASIPEDLSRALSSRLSLANSVGDRALGAVEEGEHAVPEILVHRAPGTVNGGRDHLEVIGDHGDRLVKDVPFDGLPFGIGCIQLRGYQQGFFKAVAHQQINTRNSAFHAPGGVQAWRQPEADLTTGYSSFLDPGNTFERLNAWF